MLEIIHLEKPVGISVEMATWKPCSLSIILLRVATDWVWDGNEAQRYERLRDTHYNGAHSHVFGVYSICECQVEESIMFVP